MITLPQSLLASWLILFTIVSSIEVAPNSPCSSECIDSPNLDPANPASSTTQTWNLHCQDWELSGSNSTLDGQKWEKCLSCESDSGYNDPTTNENDIMWFLFNMRFTVDWCIYGYQNNQPNGTLAMSKCGTVCSGQDTWMQAALTTLLHTNASTQYDYCDEGSAAFTENVDVCIQCLDTVPSSTTLANSFKDLRALNQACEQRPLPGSKAINLSFPLFPQNSSESTPNSSAPGASSHANVSMPSSKRLEIGLAVGLGCAFLAALVFGTLFFLHKRRAKRSSNNRTGSYAGSGISWFSNPVPAPPYAHMGGQTGHPPLQYPMQYRPSPVETSRVYHEAMSKEISEPQRVPVQYVFPPDYVSPVEVGGGDGMEEGIGGKKDLDAGGGNWL